MNLTNDGYVDGAEPVLLREEREGIAWLRLNRPRHLNALSDELLDALEAALEAIASDTSLRCVVLAGNGRAFCAGHDLAQMRAHHDASYYQSLFSRCSQIMQRLRTLPMPVIARVHGIATAAGCQLVGACDLAVAADNTRFAVSGINVGLFCSTPAVALSRAVAPKRAFEMLVTGRFIDGTTAALWGLVNQAVPEAQLDETIEHLAREIAAKSPAAIRHGKQLFYRQLGLGLPDAYALAGEVMTRNLMEPDAQAGIAAFLDKRTAPRGP